MSDSLPTEAPDISYFGVETPPEDILALPGTHWVALSGLASTGHPGGLSLVDTRSKEQTAVWPVADLASSLDITAFPDSDVPPEPGTLGTHGINLVQIDPLTFDLYVVYHGSRESIEIFRVDVHGDEPRTSWRGCIVNPDGVFGNGVTVLPDGGVAVTSFFDPRRDPIAQLFDEPTSGGVWIWNRQSGWTKVPGSDMSGPNGIEASSDGETLFVSEWTKKRVVSIPTTGGVLSEVAKTPFLPDNLRWTAPGTLLVTGQQYEPVTAEVAVNCMIHKIGCVPGFVAGTIDTAANRYVTVASTGSADYGDPTVAAPVNDEIWLGSNTFAKVAVVARPKD